MDPSNRDEELRFLCATLRRGELGLVEALEHSKLGRGKNLLLLVDQFEELFRFAQLTDSDEAIAFVDLVLASCRQTAVPIFTTITMRSDFWGNCLMFTGLPEAMNNSQFLTPRLTRDQTYDAITGPVSMFCAKIEDAVVNHIINEMGSEPDQLPLMQHLLMRMWRLASGGKPATELSEEVVLTLKHYEEAGGFEGALSNHANRTYENLKTEAQKQIAEWMFRHLTAITPEGRFIRRPARLSEIWDATKENRSNAKAVLDAFRAEGRSFLTPPIDRELTPEIVIDISHESLIRQWDRLRDWTIDEKESRRIHEQFHREALRWEKSGKDEDVLLTGVQLAEAMEWSERHSGEVQDVEREFLMQSASHRDEQVRRIVQMEEEAKRAKIERERAEKAEQLAEERAKRAEIERDRAKAQRQADEQRQRAEAESERAEQAEQLAEVEARSARRFKIMTAALALFIVSAGIAVYFYFQQMHITGKYDEVRRKYEEASKIYKEVSEKLNSTSEQLNDSLRALEESSKEVNRLKGDEKRLRQYVTDLGQEIDNKTAELRGILASGIAELKNDPNTKKTAEMWENELREELRPLILAEWQDNLNDLRALFEAHNEVLRKLNDGVLLNDQQLGKTAENFEQLYDELELVKALESFFDNTTPLGKNLKELRVRLQKSEDITSRCEFINGRNGRQDKVLRRFCKFAVESPSLDTLVELEKLDNLARDLADFVSSPEWPKKFRMDLMAKEHSLYEKTDLTKADFETWLSDVKGYRVLESDPRQQYRQDQIIQEIRENIEKIRTNQPDQAREFQQRLNADKKRIDELFEKPAIVKNSTEINNTASELKSISVRLASLKTDVEKIVNSIYHDPSLDVIYQIVLLPFIYDSTTEQWIRDNDTMAVDFHSITLKSLENLQITDMHNGRLVKRFKVRHLDLVPGIPYTEKRPTNENSVVQDLKRWRGREMSGEASSVDLVIFGHLKVRPSEKTFEITLLAVDVSAQEPKKLFFPSKGQMETTDILADVHDLISEFQGCIDMLASKVSQRFPRIKAEVHVEPPETHSPRDPPIYRIDYGSEHGLFEGMKLGFYIEDTSTSKDRIPRLICMGEISELDRQSSVVSPDKIDPLPEEYLIVITK
jgi:hypothetical protein